MEFIIITAVIAFVIIKVSFSLTEKRYYAVFDKEDPTEKKSLKNLLKRIRPKQEVSK